MFANDTSRLLLYYDSGTLSVVGTDESEQGLTVDGLSYLEAMIQALQLKNLTEAQ